MPLRVLTGLLRGEVGSVGPGVACLVMRERPPPRNAVTPRAAAAARVCAVGRSLSFFGFTQNHHFASAPPSWPTHKLITRKPQVGVPVQTGVALCAIELPVL